MRNSTDTRKILVVIPTSTNTQRQLLEGLLSYAHERTTPAWQFHLDLHDLSRQHLRDPHTWGCDGIIAYVLSAREREEYLASGLPCVFIEPLLTRPPKPRRRNVITFINDHSAEGRGAARAFLERGFASCAYVGSAAPTVWSEERCRGFTEELAAGGVVPRIYAPCTPEEQRDFGLESRRLVRWLTELPRPTGVYCVHDRRAQQVISTAVSCGIGIPEELAVIGTDNDELLCEMTTPSISSIPTRHRELGRDLGKAMDALLNRVPHDRCVISRHFSVVARRSSDADACGDPYLMKALRYVRGHDAGDFTVESLASEAGCSKATLNARSRKFFGRPFAEELRARRLSQAVSLLGNTARTVEDIARSCGFRGASHLGLCLKAATGRTPGEFRMSDKNGPTRFAGIT